MSDLTARFDRSEEDIFKAIREFGSWLAQVSGPGESDLDSESNQPQLFALPTENDRTAHIHDSLRPYPRKNEGGLRAITWHRPGMDIIRTFRLRQDNSGADKELLDSTVATIAAFARSRLGDVKH